MVYIKTKKIIKPQNPHRNQYSPVSSASGGVPMAGDNGREGRGDVTGSRLKSHKHVHTAYGKQSSFFFLLPLLASADRVSLDSQTELCGSSFTPRVTK